MYMYIYIYIYILREKERQRESQVKSKPQGAPDGAIGMKLPQTAEPTGPRLSL